MHRLRPSLKLIIPAVFLILSAFSCTDEPETSTDFGDPPVPEKCFCSPDGVETYLEWAAYEMPDILQLRTIGTSVDGRSIYAVEISDAPDTPEEEPAVLINGGIHGHEQAGTGVALKLIEHLLTGYADNDAAIVSLITDYKIHIIPAMNPDGLADSSRYNASGVDLNRNFGYNWDESAPANGDSAFDQPESCAVRDDILEQAYTLGVILHTASSQSGIGIYGPWDAIVDEPPNYSIIEYIGTDYSSTLTTAATDWPFSENSGYFHYQMGADWYVLYGSVNDWALGTLGSVLYSIELYGMQKYDTGDAELLESIWEAHRDPLLQLIESSSLGTGGRLLDADGQPVSGASILLAASGSGRAFTPAEYTALTGITDENGCFRLLTPAGDYNINFTSDTETLEAGIAVDEAGKTSVDGANAEYYPSYRLP